MRVPSIFLPWVLASGLFLDAAQPPPPAPPPAPVEGDLLVPPAGFREFVIKATIGADGYRAKTQDLVRAALTKPEQGGLGITYANDRTRTVAEVWRDRKANCISLTAFYVAACKVLDMPAIFADAPSISLWVRKGDLILNERHIVAAVYINPITIMVADFSGEPHSGAIHIQPMSEARFRALFHSNRAAELLLSDDFPAAFQEAQSAVKEDPSSGVAWNTYGAVEKALARPAGAEDAFRKAMAVDPKNGPACGNLEGVLRAQGRTAEADQWHVLSLSLRNKDPYFHAFMAKESLQAGDIQGALAHIARAIKLQRMEPDFYLILAQAEMDRGERGAAEKAVRKAIHWSLPGQRKRMESKLDLIQKQAA